MTRKGTTTRFIMTLLATTLLLMACDKKEPETGKPAVGGGAASGAAVPESLFVGAAPASAAPIAQLKQTAKEGDEVTMRVVVGGRVKPIVAGMAVMTVVDASVENKCTSEDDHCETPWDYCCVDSDAIKANSATVQIVDSEGKTLKADLTAEPRFKPLTTMTVRGKVGPRPDKEVLVVNVTSVHVEAGK